jgi:hypothetical protein
MQDPELKRAEDELNAAISIKEREFSRAFDEALAREDKEGMDKALGGYRAMIAILDDFLALLKF